MRSSANPVTLPAVSDSTGLNIRRTILELKLGSDPIEGSLTIAQGPPIAFHGWLELTALISRAMTGSDAEHGWGGSPAF